MPDATDDQRESQPSTSVRWSQLCRQFEFYEIQLATDDFDESLVIGRGGFGKVYRGTIFIGSTPAIAAIKRLNSDSNQGATEFWAEVEMLSKLRHSHLVSMFGYCHHGKEMILIYDYMPNGTLSDHLHKLGTPLSWLQRLKICIGVARGLDYLHTGTGIDSGVIHRDVKTLNILLHESWAAKISDFGLSKIAPTNQPYTYVDTDVKGSFGYMDPNYFLSGKLTRKSDVYAFGVVLLEVLCRRQAIDSSLDDEQWGLVGWAQQSIREGNLKRIIDDDIRGEISPKCLKEFVGIAERCLHNFSNMRPTMAEVVVSLDSLLTFEKKIKSPLQPAGRTIFGRMADKFPFPSKRENPARGDSQPSSNTKRNSTSASTRELPADYRIQNLKEFKFVDLERATDKFSQDLGRGGSGVVFLGWIHSKTFAPSIHGVGLAVAVKIVDQANENWQSEVVVLGRLSHPNIIRLIGYCNDTKEKYLIVYEYMQNTSLDLFLYKNVSAKPLSWETRLTIMMGVACGLAYMHSLKDQVIHRDVKSSDILLDEDFNAKLGNFVFARFGPEFGNTHCSTARVLGTWGYIDPTYCLTGHLSAKSDVYGFGVVLVEILTGLHVRDILKHHEHEDLLDFTSLIAADRDELTEKMDPRLEKNYPTEGASECAALALRCLSLEPKDRPSSEEILWSLEQIYAVDK